MEVFKVLFIVCMVIRKLKKDYKSETVRINESIQSTNCKNLKGEFPTVKKIDKNYYSILIPKGLTFQKVKELEDVISTSLKKDALIEMKNYRYYLTFPVVKKFKPFYPFKTVENKNKDLIIPIGYNIENELVWLNISKNPNMIVSGITSSGKSIFIHNLILQSLHSYEMEYTLIDLKGRNRID